MSTELLINVTPSESRVALIENGVLQEIQLERIGKSRYCRQYLLRKNKPCTSGYAGCFCRYRP